MCLLSRTSVPSIADKDIKCKKIFFQFEKSQSRSLGWDQYKKIKVESGKIYNMHALTEVNLIPETLLIPDMVVRSFEKYGWFYEIGKGYIHSYKNVNIQVGLFNPNNEETLKNVLYVYVAECIIPCGEIYFGGTFRYASSKVKIISVKKYNRDGTIIDNYGN